MPDHDDPTDELGPYYDTPGLTRRWGVSRQALKGRRERCTLLGVETDTGSILYPTWQFTPDLEVIPGLAHLLGALHDAAPDGFSKAVWLTAPQPALDGRTAVEWLGQTGDADRLVELARADVARLTR